MIKMPNRLRQENSGMSLVELLIIIAIMSITVGLSSLGLSLVFSRDAEKCANSIDSALETTRMSTMSQKGTFTLEIDTVNNRMSLTSSSAPGTELLSNSDAEFQSRVSVSLESTGGSVDISSKDKLSVTFDKSTGRVAKIYTDGDVSQNVDGTVIRIRCENSNGKKATVVLVRSTGKHYVDYQ